MPFFKTFKSPDRFSGDNAGEILLEKFDYDLDGRLAYEGATNNAHATDADEVWAIAKFTYDGNNKLVMVEYRYRVAWSERALQDWI